MTTKPVFIVNKNPEECQLMKKTIMGMGHDALRFLAVTKASRHLDHEPPRLVILEAELSGQNDHALLKKCRERAPVPIPVIIQCPLSETDLMSEFLLLGADDFIDSPPRPDDVQGRVMVNLGPSRKPRPAKKRPAPKKKKSSKLSGLPPITAEVPRPASKKKHFADTEAPDSNDAPASVPKTQVEEKENPITDPPDIPPEQLNVILTMSSLAESRQPEDGDHNKRMTEYVKTLARELRKNPIYEDLMDDEFMEALFNACPLHDIGKAGIPDNVLKKPGKLTTEEFDVMKKHTVIGAETLESLSHKYPNDRFLRIAIAIAMYHHEKWDGSGYPDGLSGEAIPLEARIVSLCDVYDALTSNLCYKSAMSLDDSRKIIKMERGRSFDPAVVDAFAAVEKKFRRIREENT